MSTKSVFLFAFANDTTNSLELHDEGKAAKQALKPLIDSERIRFEHIHGTRFTELYDEFDNYHGRMTIFHFGGHSDPKGLNLNGSEITGTKLANLLAEEKKLKLVFLNGCHNDPQVDLLLKKGIPAIIATSVNIPDELAKEFSTRFYKGLAAGRTLRGAFTIAAEFVNDKEKKPLIAFRGIGLSGKKQKEKFEWGLYVKDESVLDWTVPLSSSDAASGEQGGSGNVYNYGNIKNQINNPNIKGDLNIS